MAEPTAWMLDVIARFQNLGSFSTDTSLPDVLQEISESISCVPASASICHQVILRHVLVRVMVRTAQHFNVLMHPDVVRACLRIAAGTAWRDDCDAALDTWSTVVPSMLRSQRPLPPRVRFILGVIAEHHRDPRFSLSDAATAAGVSPYHLTRLLKRHTGMGFAPHLQRLRIESAQRLLTTTVLSVKEIASAVGYQGSSQFDRQFRKTCAITPTEFRGIPRDGDIVKSGNDNE